VLLGHAPIVFQLQGVNGIFFLVVTSSPHSIRIAVKILVLLVRHPVILSKRRGQFHRLVISLDGERYLGTGRHDFNDRDERLRIRHFVVIYLGDDIAGAEARAGCRAGGKDLRNLHARCRILFIGFGDVDAEPAPSLMLACIILPSCRLSNIFIRPPGDAGLACLRGDHAIFSGRCRSLHGARRLGCRLRFAADLGLHDGTAKGKQARQSQGRSDCP
jgi:hypothetical protein